MTSYLEVHENYDTGWAATLNGRTLTPVRLDGWQQGFVLPAGAGGAVTLTFRPAASYHLFLALSLLAIAVLLAITVWSFTGRRRRREPGLAVPSGTWPAPSDAWPAPSGADQRRRPMPARAGAWLGLLGVTALIFVAGGPVALAVPVLACLSWLLPQWAARPRWLGPPAGVLPLLAFAAMAALWAAVRGAASGRRPARPLRRARTGVRTRRAGRRPDTGHADTGHADTGHVTPAVLPGRRDGVAAQAGQEPGPGPAPRSAVRRRGRAQLLLRLPGRAQQRAPGGVAARSSRRVAATRGGGRRAGPPAGGAAPPGRRTSLAPWPCLGGIAARRPRPDLGHELAIRGGARRGQGPLPGGCSAAGSVTPVPAAARPRPGMGEPDLQRPPRGLRRALVPAVARPDRGHLQRPRRRPARGGPGGRRGCARERALPHAGTAARRSDRPGSRARPGAGLRVPPARIAQRSRRTAA